MTKTFFFIKNITFTFYFSKGVVAGVCERQGNEGTLPYWPITSSLYRTTLCFLRSLTSLPFLLSGQRPLTIIALPGCQAASLRDPPYLNPRLWIENWPLQDFSYLLLGVYIYIFTLSTYSSGHPRDVLPLI